MLAPDLQARLAGIAAALDVGEPEAAACVLPMLGGHGLFRIGVSDHQGGAGGDVADAVDALAAVAEQSMAAGFVFWSQRVFVEYLLRTPNQPLTENLLPNMLAGRLAGATGLSNAMKFLSGLEALQLSTDPDAPNRCSGRLPWVTNLRPKGFVVAAMVGQAEGPALCLALAHDAPGLDRSDDLELMGMRGTSTAALRAGSVPFGAADLLHADAAAWLPRVRPAFLGLQCGLSIGLARRALHEAELASGAGRHVLDAPVQDARTRLEDAVGALLAGLRDGRFVADAAALFRLRITLAETAAEAVSLELQALGGRAYLTGPGASFQRRWRESAFVPLITPSLVQLRTELARLDRRHAAA